MSDLTDKLIEETYEGVLHTDGEIPRNTQAIIYDGLGNPSSISIGFSGGGVSITGKITTDSLSSKGEGKFQNIVTENFTSGLSGVNSNFKENVSFEKNANIVGSLVAGNVSYPTVSGGNVTIFDLIWPVNSIYFSMIDVNPSTYWPGTTWVRVSEGRYLTGIGTDAVYGIEMVEGKNDGSFQETYNLGMVDHIHGVGGANFSNNTTPGFLARSWTLKNASSYISFWAKNMNSGSGTWGGETEFQNLGRVGTGFVTSTPLDPTTGLPIQETDTIDIKPPSFAMYVWQRTK